MIRLIFTGQHSAKLKSILPKKLTFQFSEGSGSSIFVLREENITLLLINSNGPEHVIPDAALGVLASNSRWCPMAFASS